MFTLGIQSSLYPVFFPDPDSGGLIINPHPCMVSLIHIGYNVFGLFHGFT